MKDHNTPSLTCSPIGFMRTGHIAKFSARYQPNHESTARLEDRSYIELIDDEKILRATKDLRGFERIWIVWWFDKNPNWRPLVRPPRGDGKRKGVFSTRAPYRPNPIGITATTLLHIDGRSLYLGEIDLVDGTAILDIKPYIPKVDSFPESEIGWLQEIEDQENLPPSFEVILEEKCRSKLLWLKENFQIDFLPRAIEILSRDPSPHRTRRIVRMSDTAFRMGCGAWRLFFSVQERIVRIYDVDKGYPDDMLSLEGYEDITDRDAQIAFHSFFATFK